MSRTSIDLLCFLVGVALITAALCWALLDNARIWFNSRLMQRKVRKQAARWRG